MSLKILINGQQLDVFDAREFPLSLDFQITDVSDPNVRKGSGSSSTFSVPATEKNDKIFNLFGSLSVSSDNVRIFRDVVIQVDGLTVSSGSARVRKADLRSNKTRRKALQYEIIFLTDNSDWFTLLQNTTLKDLSFTDHEYIPSNITSGWSAMFPSDDYGYTLIKTKAWQNTGFVIYEEFTPFLFIKDIIQKSFASIGYTIDSTFLSSSLADKLILPVFLRTYSDKFSAERANMRAEKTITVNHTTTVGDFTISYDDDSTPPNFDAGSNFVDPIYTTPFSGDYRVRAFITVDNIGGAGNGFCQLDILVNGFTVIPAYSTFSDVSDGDRLEVDEVINLDQSDTIEIIFRAAGMPSSYDLTVGTLQIECVRPEFKLNNIDIVWSELVPEYSVRDMIIGVAQMFNLFIYGDAISRTVRIETRDTFINSERDVTSLVDYLKTGEKSLLDIEKELVFQYKEDSNDETAEALIQNQVLRLQSARYTLSDVNAVGRKVISNSFFAETIHIKDKSIAGFDGEDTAPQIPLIFPSNYLEDPTTDQTTYDFEPRILIHKGRISTGGPDLQSPEGSISLLAASPSTRGSFPKSYAVDYDDNTVDSLSYADEVINGVTVKGLVSKYYMNELASLNQGVQLTESIRYKLTDISSFDFSEKFKISAVSYIVQKIEKFKPVLSDSTKTVLLEDICHSQDDLDRVDNTDSVSLITEPVLTP